MGLAWSAGAPEGSALVPFGCPVDHRAGIGMGSTFDLQMVHGTNREVTDRIATVAEAGCG